MHRHKFPSLCLLGLAFLAFAGLCAADPAESDETRLRETLRATVLQLRDAQTDQATLQAAQAAAADEKQALQAQVDLLKKHAVEDLALSGKVIGDLKAKAAEQASEIDKLKEVLGQWEAEAQAVAKAARKAQAQKAEESAEIVLLQRRVDDLEGKNVALYSLATEILARYEKFSLGEQFLAREPFIGNTRVALENQIQGYGDKLLDQRAGH